jgi:hypothetical protein
MLVTLLPMTRAFQTINELVSVSPEYDLKKRVFTEELNTHQDR